MNIVWKAILTFLVVIIIGASGLAITMGNMDVTTANNYFEELSQIIIESNYNEKIITDCIAEAVENDYKLEVIVRGDDKPGTKKYVEAIFTYQYEIPVLQISEQKIKRKIL